MIFTYVGPRAINHGLSKHSSGSYDSICRFVDLKISNGDDAKFWQIYADPTCPQLSQWLNVLPCLSVFYLTQQWSDACRGSLAVHFD
jgi:hypothetical protein